MDDSKLYLRSKLILPKTHFISLKIVHGTIIWVKYDKKKVTLSSALSQRIDQHLLQYKIYKVKSLIILHL